MKRPRKRKNQNPNPPPRAKPPSAKPREPQMVTVNGDKVTHGHAYQSKTNPEDWYFTAKINGEQLKPQKMDPADLVAYKEKELTVPQLMERYYPTKLYAEGAGCSLSSGNVLPEPAGNPTIDKFNVYKETDETRADYGKYKFYAQVGDKKMSTTASREDLNAYFDRVATPGQPCGAQLRRPSAPAIPLRAVQAPGGHRPQGYPCRKRTRRMESGRCRSTSAKDVDALPVRNCPSDDGYRYSRPRPPHASR